MRSRSLNRVAKSGFLLVASILMIAPFLWALSTSFKLPGDVFAYPPRFLPDPFTAANYQNVITVIPFLRYFLNSTIVTGTIVILNVIFGTAAAYAFAKLRFPGRDRIFFLLLLTLMVPFQVNLIPLYKMMVELHKAIPFLGADTYMGLVAPSAIQVFGIFLMRGFLRSIPDEILESRASTALPRCASCARSCSHWRCPGWPPWPSSRSCPRGTISCGRWS